MSESSNQRGLAKLCGLHVSKPGNTHSFAVRQPDPRGQPSPLGRGCHALALSSAGAWRV